MLETGWCTKYCTIVQHTARLNTSSNSQDTDDACLGFDTISENYAFIHLQGDEQTLGKPENLHVHDHTMICKMQTQEYFTPSVVLSTSISAGNTQVHNAD
jgi:hypothetical protein